MTDQHEELDISGVKIAIVDDAKTIRMMMSHTLKGMGCEVECAEDGYKALGMLRRFKPDLIFLDITMPELDGYQTCTLIRNAEDTRNRRWSCCRLRTASSISPRDRPVVPPHTSPRSPLSMCYASLFTSTPVNARPPDSWPVMPSRQLKS